MRAIHVSEPNSQDPLGALRIGDLPERRDAPAGWVRVRLRATAWNHHDIWSLRGVGLPQARLPMILGTDGAGETDDGTEVIVHAVVADRFRFPDETLDPKRTLLSEYHPGTFAETVWVPEHNLLPKPASLTFEQAAALPTAYLTAFRLLTGAGELKPGQRVLIQGARGGVASAAILLARGMGAHVIVSSRSETGRAFAAELGAHQVIESGERVAPVDVAVETVGEATWEASLKSLRPGGVIAVAGATSGAAPSADLSRVFFRGLRIHGSTMGTYQEFCQLLGFLESTGIDPLLDQVITAQDDDAVRASLERLIAGEQRGKIVLDWS